MPKPKPTVEEQELSLVWTGTSSEPERNGVVPVTLETSHGGIVGRYHPVRNAEAGVIWVGGAGGGLDGPARGLYPEACRLLQERNVAGLRLDYRYPNLLHECVLDVLVGVEFLSSEKVQHLALVGHSFGGAVVITAGALSDAVEAVVPMSTQSYGTNLAPKLSPKSLLLIHGTNDSVLSDTCSREVYRIAGEPKTLKLYSGARHGLDEVRQQVLELLIDWIPKQLQIES